MLKFRQDDSLSTSCCQPVRGSFRSFSRAFIPSLGCERWNEPDESVEDAIKREIELGGGLPGFYPSVRRQSQLKSLGPVVPKDRNPRSLPRNKYLIPTSSPLCQLLRNIEVIVDTKLTSMQQNRSQLKSNYGLCLYYLCPQKESASYGLRFSVPSN